MSWGVVLDAMKTRGVTTPPVGAAATLHTEVLLHPSLPYGPTILPVFLNILLSADADDSVGPNNHLQLSTEGLPWGQHHVDFDTADREDYASYRLKAMSLRT